MENASKALLISGGVLIAMLVISIGIYLFANYRGVSSSYEQIMSTTEIEKFNVNFTKFEGRDDITIQEIVTIVNFVKQHKEKTEIDVQVFLKNDELKDNDIVTLIKNNSTDSNGKIKYFKCGIDSTKKDIEYNENGMVKLIRFN